VSKELRLRAVSFTTCPKGSEDWKMFASEIVIDKRNSPFGEALQHQVLCWWCTGIFGFLFAFPFTRRNVKVVVVSKILAVTSKHGRLEYEAAIVIGTLPPKLMTQLFSTKNND